MELGGYLKALAHGLDVVEQCAGLTHEQLVALGARPGFAQQLLELHHIYFAATAFSGRQRTARTSSHDVHTLLRIEEHCARLPQAQAWKLRAELALTPAEQIDAVARRRLKELRPARAPEAGVRVTRRSEGNHTISITDSPLRIADLLGAFKARNPKDLLAGVHDVAFSGGGAPTTLQTNVLVHLDELVQILNGDGEEIELQLTNGATITGAEFVRRTLADVGLVTLIHPHHGSVNLYQDERFANTKQRLAKMAEYPRCVWKDCLKPAEEAQFHHIERWEDGGFTNLDNLVPLCAYHNAVNDDDPAKPTGRGRIVRVGGRVAWLPPWGGPPQLVPSRAHDAHPSPEAGP
ncbi:HNH endonuclease signature motif containing protein [Corynebacterium sp.]|uniref:HNH endonuclease signature motif containing protein n=1 Tax=Corynebacterium sp. TaxID=1720 RepID=UPI0026DA9E2C|nr:HNH endonuclease signature motif containing protein [Corynebacterium sp.]MDO5031240.1 HNH endonuclease signature motif containing protein [Corynebacterium sp.]